jgi:hypothetical protein
MDTLDFAIQPCKSKFTFWKLRENKNFREFNRFFQTGFSPNKFGPNSKAVSPPGILIQFMF